MASKKSDFGDLLREVDKQERAQAQREVPLTKGGGKPPDAVVYVHQTLYCYCGNRFDAPNTILLFRHGNTRKPIDHWVSTYNGLPRETLTVEKTVPACSECFGGAWLEAKQVISKTRT